METQLKTNTQRDFRMQYPRLIEIDEKPDLYIQHIHDFVKNPTGFYLIAGKNGNGKTFTAEAIFGRFYHPATDNMFWNLADLKIKWQSTYCKDAKYGATEYLLNEILKAPLLVLDDLGQSTPSDTFKEFLYIIADKRYKQKHLQGTIITTNLDSESMRLMFGDAFMSRVTSGICVRWDGPDRRLANV